MHLPKGKDVKKTDLLGGVARIVREPSLQEMRDAMLRRMGAGHILDGGEEPQQPPAPAPRRPSTR